MTVTALSDESVGTFNLIQEAAETGVLALVSTALDGVPASALAVIEADGEGYIVRPVAILVDDALFARLSDPSEGLPPSKED